jgi:thiosulfate/3-mercaptopyruvate sulfurtransferase
MTGCAFAFQECLRMHRHQSISAAFVVLSLVILTGVVVASFAGAASNGARRSAASDPWSARQTVEPPALVKELAGPAAERPKVICVGFRTLYEGAHVPGASFHGPAMKPEGLADLKKWAAPLPHSANVVIYCGCCPLAHCPNIRPAFSALQEMGFTHVRVLLLPQDFAHDWVSAGYPVSKGK